MGLNTTFSNVGIDKVIKSIQSQLYTRISEDVALFGIECYGRIFKNPSDNGFIAEWYDKDIEDYREVYYNEEFGLVFFFIVSDQSTTNDEFVFSSKVKCVFMCNLERGYGSVIRNDEVLKADLVSILRDISLGRYEITGTDNDIESIFSGFDIEKIKLNNMQPLYCLAVLLDMHYELLPNKC